MKTLFDFQRLRLMRQFSSGGNNKEVDRHLNELIIMSESYSASSAVTSISGGSRSSISSSNSVNSGNSNSGSNSNSNVDVKMNTHSLQPTHTHSHYDQLQEFEKALTVSHALFTNPTIELDGLINGLSGGFIPAAPGGDIIRDGVNVLPTGRNIYALDPYRIPSELAMIRGKQAVELILKAHRLANDDMYPETVAVTLWGLDAIKTKVINRLCMHSVV